VPESSRIQAISQVEDIPEYPEIETSVYALPIAARARTCDVGTLTSRVSTDTWHTLTRNVPHSWKKLLHASFSSKWLALDRLVHCYKHIVALEGASMMHYACRTIGRSGRISYVVVAATS
jgi:hypothetical protein